MADEKLTAELAQHLAERDGRRSLFTATLDATERTYRDEYLRTARVALAWLAERGRLVPDGAQVEVWWNVRFTPSGSPPDYRKITWDTASTDREDAEEWLREWANHQPELIRCEIHHYPDGSYLTTAWETVAEEREEPT